MPEVTRIKPIRLHWDKNRCTDCMSCTVVCSERHLGMSAPSRSRIRIHVDVLGGGHRAEYCRQCRNALCAADCPDEAIGFDDQLRAWLVDDDLCTGCGLCVEACPFDAIWLDPDTGLAVKCDLCLGATRCVEIYPPNALVLKGQTDEGDDDE